MRITSSIVVITLCAGLLAACSKQETQPAAPAPETPQTATEAPKAAAEVQKAAEAASSTAQEAASSAASSAQSMIDKAQALMADSKYSEAMDLLKRLSSMELTPDQKKLVDDLMAQAQKALAGAATSDASKSVGGLLGK
jgi:hypothetical protein